MYFPVDASAKALDVTVALHRAQDQGKESSKRPPLPSFPVFLPSERVDPKLVDFLWPMEEEPPTPFQLVDPEAKLMAAANQARHQMASRVSSLALTCLQRDVLHALAPIAASLHKDNLT